MSRIAELVCDGLGVPDARIEYSGNNRGWIGDVPKTDRSIELLWSYGTLPVATIVEGISKNQGLAH
ncbi:MAG: hypothetical protein ACFFER_02020 [Candidatus Thorarchaeota archaeon]